MIKTHQGITEKINIYDLQKKKKKKKKKKKLGRNVRGRRIG